MKYSISRKLLEEKLRKVYMFVPSKSTLPVLETIYMAIENGSLSLAGTNMDRGLKITGIECTALENGGVCVDADKIKEIVTNFVGETIELYDESNSLFLKCGKSKSKLVIIPEVEYPPFRAFPENDKKIIFKMSDWITVSNMVSFCTGTDNAKPHMTGIAFFDGKARATNTFVLSSFPFETFNNKKIIVPKEPFKLIQQVYKPEDEISWTYDSNLVYFTDGVQTVYSTLFEEVYPDFSSILDRGHKTEVKVNTSELAKSVKLVGTICAGSNNIVILDCTAEGINVKADSAEVGNIDTVVECSISGVPTMFAVNHEFLTKILSSAYSNDLVIYLNGGRNIVVFKDNAKPEWICAVMPLSL